MLDRYRANGNPKTIYGHVPQTKLVGTLTAEWDVSTPILAYKDTNK